MTTDFKTYLFEYAYQGSTWVLEIKAESPEDARLRARQSLTYLGEVQAKVTAPPLLGWLRKLFGIRHDH
ncbi:hypothetical protein ACEN9J_02735 [Variovorax sp. Varisp41]|uniref:hypothetical protein n=1 Tax=Variovorax sp. Varisp41 TaxID=3243033 RepID=UPI0039B55696